MGQSPLRTSGPREGAEQMTRSQLIQEAYALLQEKDLECSTENLQILQAVGRYLAQRGVPLSREILDFTIDVLRVKTFMGLPPDTGSEDLEAVRAEMTEWLEALGWRRTWFDRPVGRAG
jgi:hypothetical protein